LRRADPAATKKGPLTRAFSVNNLRKLQPRGETI
jgi:hypothetical protein